MKPLSRVLIAGLGALATSLSPAIADDSDDFHKERKEALKQQREAVREYWEERREAEEEYREELRQRREQALEQRLVAPAFVARPGYYGRPYGSGYYYGSNIYAPVAPGVPGPSMYGFGYSYYGAPVHAYGDPYGYGYSPYRSPHYGAANLGGGLYAGDDGLYLRLRGW